MLCAGYIRVSTVEQSSDRHYSIPEQTERLKAYCLAKGWTLKHIYTDAGYSGKSLDRPAMQQLISECKSYDIILVNKLDRLSRSQKDTLYLIEDVFRANGVQFASMSENFDTTTPLGIAMVGIMSVFAQLERETIKERMNMGRNARAKKGLWRGGGVKPYGYDYAGKGLLVPNHNAPTVKRMFEMYRDGYTINQIQRVINKETGDFDRLATVSDVLKNPIYIGKMKWNGEILDGIHEPIISQELFDEVQSRRAAISQTLPDVNKKPFQSKHLLSGFLFCGECGSRYCVVNTKSKNRPNAYTYYGCARKRRKSMKYSAVKCTNIAYREDRLNAILTESILSIDFDKITFEDKPVEQQDYSKEIAKIEKQIERLIDLYTEDGIDKPTLTSKINSLRAKQEKLTSNKPVRIVPKKQILDIKDDIKNILNGDDMNAKRRVFDALISKVTINHENIDISWTF